MKTEQLKDQINFSNCAHFLFFLQLRSFFLNVLKKLKNWKKCNNSTPAYQM